MFNTSEGHQKIAEFIQQSWKDNLGVEVKLANQEWGVYLKTLTEDAPQIYRLGWCADYPDENNWVLEVFHPDQERQPTQVGRRDRASAQAVHGTDRRGRRRAGSRRAQAALL